MALLDAYGLSLVSVEVWGLLFGVLSAGFIVGGLIVARRGLGANPLRTLLVVNVVMWAVSSVFTLRSSILLLAVGMFVWLCLVPFAEAAEQTVLQKVVPFERQGRVFGFAQSVEHGRVAADRVPDQPDRAVRRHPVHDHRGGRRASSAAGSGRGPSAAWRWSSPITGAHRAGDHARSPSARAPTGGSPRATWRRPPWPRDRVPRSGRLLTRPGDRAPPRRHPRVRRPRSASR